MKATVRGACPEDGEADAFAVSAEGAAVTVMVRDLLAVALTLSVMVRVAA